MKKSDNRSNGGRFEQSLANTLADAGFWVHVIQQNKAGQPADLIAVKGRYHTLIDCKVISDNKGFPFKRIEENQKFAMSTFRQKCGELCWFALRLPGGYIGMISSGRMAGFIARGMKQLNEEEIREQAMSLEMWIKETDIWGKD